MVRILVDTNFLLSQFEYGVDVPSELLRISSGPVQLLVASGTMNELSTLSGRNGRRSVAARFALQHFDELKKRFSTEIIPSEGAVDEWIIKYAKKNRVNVATNDLPLRRQLLALGVPVIAMKGKSKLDYV